MASLDVLLRKEARRRRHQLAHFFEALSLYLEAGLDLGYAWPHARQALAGNLPTIEELLAQKDGETIADLLARLSSDFPETGDAVWFSVLGELYERGAGLREGVAAAARALREAHQRELDAHCRELPSRANIILLVFFLPPTLLLLFAPLLAELLRSF